MFCCAEILQVIVFTLLYKFSRTGSAGQIHAMNHSRGNIVNYSAIIHSRTERLNFPNTGSIFAAANPNRDFDPAMIGQEWRTVQQRGPHDHR